MYTWLRELGQKAKAIKFFLSKALKLKQKTTSSQRKRFVIFNRKTRVCSKWRSRMCLPSSKI